MSTELTAPEPQFQIQQSPEQVIEEAGKAAKMLMDLVRQNGWSKKIGQGEHLQVEAWQVVGKFYGMTVKTKATEYVEFGKAKGFNAIVEVLNSQGTIIGGAESMCLDDEYNWKGKPLFSLKSMAQTRAAGKALRQMLSWVVVLAGFKPTPAEEMDHLSGAPQNDQQASAQAIAEMREAKRNPFNKEDDWIEGAVGILNDEEVREPVCSKCGAPELPKSVIDYSMQHWDRVLCFSCQKLIPKAR